MRALQVLMALSVLFVAGCAGVATGGLEPPEVSLVNITPTDEMTLFEQRYDVSLRIQNPNNQSLPVSGLRYNLALNGKDFARGVSHDDVDVPALGDAITHVMVSSGPLDWLNQINQMQSHPDLRPSYKVSGTIYLGGYGARSLPFEKSGTLGGQ